MKIILYAAMAIVLTGCFGLTDTMIAKADYFCVNNTAEDQRDLYRKCMAGQYEELKDGIGEAMDELSKKPDSEQ